MSVNFRLLIHIKSFLMYKISLPDHLLQYQQYIPFCQRRTARRAKSSARAGRHDRLQLRTALIAKCTVHLHSPKYYSSIYCISAKKQPEIYVLWICICRRLGNHNSRGHRFRASLTNFYSTHESSSYHKEIPVSHTKFPPYIDLILPLRPSPFPPKPKYRTRI